jgi:nitrilase
MSGRRIHAAVVQAASVGFDRIGSLRKLRALTRDAACEGARLAVFPEAFIGGYPRGLDFGAVVGSRTGEGREWYRRYSEGAVEIPGAGMEEIREIARESRIFLVVGVIEREGGTLYCTAVFVDETGEYKGKRRKLMPTAAERVCWGQGDGSTLTVVDSSVGKLGAAICWENYMPMLRMALYAKGVEVWCAPTADARDSWQASMRHIAMEGRCFVLAANQFTTRSDYPADYPATSPDCRGGSVIVDPMGEVLAGPLWDREGILTAELDLDAVSRGKLDFDVVGHYARPDVFRLEVDESPKPAVLQKERGAR